jgi:hypothetical protein
MIKYYSFFLFLFLVACKDSTKIVSNPILLGDSNTIVTETDYKKLENYTEDISLVGKKNSADKDISSMMMKVDSLEATKNVSNTTASTPLAGYTIKNNSVEITIDKLAISNTISNTAEKSLSLVGKKGTNLENALIKITGLNDCTIQQRITTKLFAENNITLFELNDFGKFILPWATLATSNNVFESLGSNALQFHTVDNAKISNAIDRELRKKNANKAQLEEWKTLYKDAKTYTDKPCRVIIIAIEYKINGLLDGKKYSKLIRIDIPR